MKQFSQIFFIGLIILINGCSAKKSDTEYLDAAKGYINNGSYNEATIELKNALQSNSFNAEARYLLGKISLELGDSATAVKELQQALELSAAQPVPPLLARAWLVQQNYDEAISLDGSALKLVDQSDLLVSQGIAQLALKNKEKALELFDRASSINPDAVYPLEGYARARLAEGDVVAARDLLHNLLQKDEKNVAAWSLLGKIEQAAGNLVEAEEAFGKAIEYKINNFDDIVSRALVRISANNVSQAEQDLNSLPESFSSHPSVNYARGLIFLDRKAYDQAQETFEKVLNTTGDYTPALFYAGLSHYSLNQHALAEDKLDRYIAKIPNYPPANRMLGIIKLRRGDYAEAEVLFRKAQEVQQEDQALATLLADTLFAQNKLNEAVEVLRTQVEKTPKSIPARMALAKGFTLGGNAFAAIAELKRVLEIEPSHTQANALLVQFYIKAGDSQKALQVTDKFIESSSGSVNAYNLLASTHLSLGNEAEAKTNFGKVLENNPLDYSANGGLAVIAVKGGELDVAHLHYQKVLEGKPEDLKTLMNVADIYMAQEDQVSARKTIVHAAESHSEAIEPRIRLGWFYAKEDKPEQIPELFNELKEKFPDNVAMLVLLADSAYNLNQFNEAEQYLKHIRQLDPENAGMAYSLAKTYAKLRKNKEYLAALNEVLDLNSENIPARIDLANYLVVLNKIDDAEKHVNFLNQRVKGRAEVLLLEGKIAETRGDFSSAVAAYEPIYNYTKNNINLVRLTNAVWMSGDQQKALVMLETWLSEHEGDQIVQLDLASRYLSLDRGDDAIELYKAVLKEFPDNLLAVNNLAWLLKDSDNSQALSLAEKAYKTKSESPELMDTLAMVLTIRGKKDDLVRAQRLLENSMKKQPENFSYKLHSAQVDIAIGETALAKEKLQDLVNTGSPEGEKAQALLQQLD